MAEAVIRQRVADGVEAVRAKDIDTVIALYAVRHRFIRYRSRPCDPRSRP